MDHRIGAKAFKYFKIAYEHQMKGEFDQAILNYKKSLEIEPSAEAFTFLGWTYSFLGRIEEAIVECHKAIAIDPDFGNPYNDIGAYYLQLGEFEKAIAWLERAMGAKRYDNPEFPHCNLGKAYELKGLWPTAFGHYRKALEIRPDYEPAKSAIQRLEVFLN
jgi:tetratricopeptide (TPR) repeat protein